MPQIVSNNTFNPASLQADDLYVVLLPPPSYISGAATGVAAAIGTASWGPVNKPMLAGSPQQAAGFIGSVGAAALTDPFDLATDVLLAFNQSHGQQAAFQLWLERISDGTDTAASVSLTGQQTFETVTVGGTATANDVLHITVTLPGGAVPVTYTVLSGDTPTTMATGLKAAIDANATLSAAGVTATSTGAVVSIAYPVTSPVTTFSESVTGSTETLTLATSSNPTAVGGVVAGLYTGILGNQIKLQVQAGAATNTLTVVVQPFQGGNAELYPNLPSSGTSFWLALQNAINNGLSNFRGPSQLLRMSGASSTVQAPAVGTYALTGGTDGRSGVTSATFIGVNTSPATGMYALQGLNPAPGVVWFAGLTDSTVYSTIEGFVDSIGAWTTLPFPTGTPTATALTDAQTLGIADYNVSYNLFGAYFFDQVNNQVRLVRATPIICGIVASLAPQFSPSNVAVYGVIGTERNNPYTGNQPFTIGEIGQLENAGIMFLSNPIPAGSVWGIRHGQNTSSNPAQSGVEYARMTNFLAQSFANTMGTFVGGTNVQTTQQNDPLRQQVTHSLTAFCQSLGSQIDSYLVTCVLNTAPNAVPGAGVNTPASIAQRYIYAMVQVRYLSTVRFFVLALQGGTTVVTSGATINEALAA